MTNRLQDPIKLFLHAVSLSCLLYLTACSKVQPNLKDNSLQIHAGSPGGAYSQLVALLDKRLTKICDPTAESADEPGSCLGDLDIQNACPNGGSVVNLRRLGHDSAG